VFKTSYTNLHGNHGAFGKHVHRRPTLATDRKVGAQFSC